jgi:hypothetical protein
MISQLGALAGLITGIGEAVASDSFDADIKTRKFDFWYQ